MSESIYYIDRKSIKHISLLFVMRRVEFYGYTREQENDKKFPDNYISTTKYNLITFLPMVGIFFIRTME